MEGGGWSSFAAPLPDAHPASPVHYYSALYICEAGAYAAVLNYPADVQQEID